MNSLWPGQGLAQSTQMAERNCSSQMGVLAWAQYANLTDPQMVFGCHEVAQKESQSIATIAARNFAVTFASGAASPPHSGTACPSHCSRRAQYTCWRKNNEGKTPFKMIRERQCLFKAQRQGRRTVSKYLRLKNEDNRSKVGVITEIR